MGKCKVFIYGVYPIELKKDPGKLPDCEQAAPLFGGCLDGNGMFSYPNIGATVWCFFENGDQNRPVYFASTLGDATKSGANYSNIEQKTSANDGAYIHKICCGESTLTFSNNGDIVIETNHFDPSKKKPISRSVISLNSAGSVEINTDNQVKITTKSTTIVSKDKIELDSDIVKIKARKRFTLASPRISMDAIFDADSSPSQISKTGENSIRLHSDSINLDAEYGGINYISMTNSNGSL